jgi:hypothetical protein
LARRRWRGREIGSGGFEPGIELAVLQHDENVALRDELIFLGQHPFDARLHAGKETDDVALDFGLLADHSSGPTGHCLHQAWLTISDGLKIRVIRGLLAKVLWREKVHSGV